MKKSKFFTTTFCTYSVSKVLGEGGSGIVYLVKDQDGEIAAIKLLSPARATSEKLKRFKNEFTFCSRVDHPNIIKVIDHGITEESEAFFVMAAYQSSLRPLIGKIDAESAISVFEKILDGVEAAHKFGVVHRDLKPENILVSESGKELVVADFGIARFEEEDLYTAIETKDGTRLANFQYAAPEQKARGRAVGQPADIYALGLILNELFTADVPHGTKYRQISEVAQEYSYLDSIVERMLAQDPQQRFNSIDEIKCELIARGRENIARQRLSQTKKNVVSIGDLDDPMIDDPMKIIGVDWENSALSIQLNHNVNPNWIWAINNLGSYSSLMGKAPENFNFQGNKAVISAQSHDAQAIVNHFKQWLTRAHQVYVDKLKRDRDAEEFRLKQALQQKIRVEEERAKVLGALQF